MSVDALCTAQTTLPADITFFNGVQVAAALKSEIEWQHTQPPSRQDCITAVQQSDTQYITAVDGLQLCLKTAQGRYAILWHAHIVSDNEIDFQMVLWDSTSPT